MNVQSPVGLVAYMPNGRHIVGVSYNSIIRTWDTVTGQETVLPLRAYDWDADCIAISPTGQEIASCSWRSTILRCDVASGKLIGEPLRAGSITAVSYSPDGTRLACVTDDTFLVWNVSTSAPAANPLILAGRARVTCAAFSPNGTYIGSASAFGTIRLWNIAARAHVATFEAKDSGWRRTIRFSPNGYIATGCEDFSVRIWDARTWEPLGALLTGHENDITSVAFSPDGRSLVSGGSLDETVRILDLPSRRPERNHFNSDLITAVSYSPDGTRLACVTDDSFLVWNVSTSAPAANPLILGGCARVTRVAFSPNGKYIGSASADGTVWVWDIAVRERVATLKAKDRGWLRSIRFSPDGIHFASSSRLRVHIWNIHRGKIETELESTSAVTDIALSPSGQYIATGCEDWSVRIWDARTGQPVGAPLTGHENDVTSIAFSPDGRSLYIATGSTDGRVRIWDTRTWQPLGAPLTVHELGITSVAFSPDGRTLASSSEDKTIRTWDLFD
ncbi:WD40 repeat-like protein [Auricularia subglabra TFB-10046 SS5]|nr:WD40 repeat-like protein [Auricularia subglabra TFB-10046 SS5]